jgi:hypothetical protein
MTKADTVELLSFLERVVPRGAVEQARLERLLRLLHSRVDNRPTGG